MNIDVVEMGADGRLNWGDISKYKITFEPSDFDADSKPSRATGTLTCTGCTDETEQYWKLEAADGTRYVVAGNVIYDALITRMIRIRSAKQIADGAINLAKFVAKELGNSCLDSCQKAAEKAGEFLKNIEIPDQSEA